LSDKENSLELPEERLATTDSQGRRVFLHPLEVYGFYRRIRSWLHLVLLFVFLATPWIHWHGSQLILLDIPQRRFSFFGLTFWAHETPLVFFVFAGVALGLVWLTAIWGRVWCGYACPQTVFIEALYRRVERLIEGNSHQRRALDKAAWSFHKIFLRGLKWVLYFAISWVITNSFLAYFVGSQPLIDMVLNEPESHWVPFVMMLFWTLVLTFNFGWFREQFCVIMCPYGRFQSVMMDPHSMIVYYDQERGEPRKGSAPKGQEGDCVNCYRCVAVCPTGIDIRRGVQMECIACTACMDACDEIMTKVKKPKGLIRYARLAAPLSLPFRLFRPRVYLLTLLLGLLLGSFTYLISMRQDISVEVLRAKGLPYTEISDDIYSNHFVLEVNNLDFVTRSLQMSTETSVLELVTAQNPIEIPAGKTVRVDVFITFPVGFVEGGRKLANIKIESKNLILVKELPLVGPNR